jgi:tRNA (guanine26-N2/guanine27-N2)-dimethyltransferase
MVLDRDLGVAFATAHFGRAAGHGWDMLSATGARGLRLLVESGAFSSFLFTEAHPVAAEVLRQNSLPVPGAMVRCADARTLPPESPFDYVDLDPYGSPLSFLPTAIQALRPGGVLAVTATDLMVLAGVQPGACERLYGSRPVRGRLGPEGGLRVLLAYLARTARSEGRCIRPLLTYVRGHHVRIYVEIVAAAGGALSDPVGLIEPETWTGPFLGNRGPYGPLWLGPLFDPNLATRLGTPPSAARPKETEEFLSRVRCEAEVDRPFYYEANELAGALGLPFPPARDDLSRGLTEKGFRFSRTHMRPEGFRTDAPRAVVEATTAELSHASVSRAPGPGRPEGRPRDVDPANS